jgi:hypothetical protein
MRRIKLFEEFNSVNETWKKKLHDVYTDKEDFLSYDEIYGITKRLGYEDPDKLWQDNPTVSGSTNPEDLKIVEGDSRKVYSLSELQSIEKWIDTFTNKLDALPDEKRNRCLTAMEQEFDEDTMKIIDGNFSADKLHYHQNGATGGIDTYPFISDFKKISKKAEEIYSLYSNTNY